MSGMLVAPLSHAQQPARKIRIGALTQVNTLRQPVWRSFFEALAARGWREGDEYALDVREALGDPNRALNNARELVAGGVDLLLAVSTANAVAAQKATKRVPTVTWCGYPVEVGLVQSLARPGGNLTGVANYAGAAVWGKFVELLRELKPGMRELGVLWDYAPPAFPDGPIPLPVIQETAQKMGIKANLWMVRSLQDLDAGLAAIARSQVEGIIVSSGGGFHNQFPERIAEVLVKRRLPAITDVANSLTFEKTNSILAYSPNVSAVLGRLADFVDRILRGANPGMLPFELPARFDLAVSAKAAKALGIAIPQTILMRADQVIE